MPPKFVLALRCATAPHRYAYASG